MIGNDVIDLRDPETASVHPRFDARVFAPAEQALLGASADPGRLRWLLWAAKEAAYKLARKLDRGVIFSPPRFVVNPTAGEIVWEGRRLRLEIDADRDRIHAVASIAGADNVLRGVGFVGEVAPGAAARSLARGALAPRLDLPLEELAVVPQGRIPRLSAGGRFLPVDLSLSHHGRFVAFAATLSVVSLGETPAHP